MQRPLTFEQFQTQQCRTVPCRECGTINHRRPSRLCHECLQPYHLIKCANLTKKVSSEIRRWKCRTCRYGNNNAGEEAPIALHDDDIVNQLPDLVGSWKRKIKVLTKIPKGARVAAAEAYCALLDQITENNNVTSWARLFGFGYSALKCPPKAPPKDAHQPSLTTIVRNQVNSYMAAPILPSSDETKNNTTGYRDVPLGSE